MLIYLQRISCVLDVAHLTGLCECGAAFVCGSLFNVALNVLLENTDRI